MGNGIPNLTKAKSIFFHPFSWLVQLKLKGKQARHQNFRTKILQLHAVNAPELNAIAYHWFAAFNAHNLEELLKLYSEEAEHYSPKLKDRQPESNGSIKGKEALRQWWKGAFERLPTLQYKVVRLTPFQDRVFMEYIRHVAGEADLYVGEMLEIKDGIIIASQVYHR